MSKEPTVTITAGVVKNNHVDIKILKSRLNSGLINIRHIVEMLVTFELFKKVINWHMLLMDYLGLLRHGQGVVELRNGAKLFVRWGTTDKWTIHEIILRDDYGINEIADECETVVDLGANIGVFSVFIASLNNRLKVCAFEPDPNNFTQLVNNIELNRLSSRIHAIPEACARKAGHRRLYLSLDHGGHSLLQKRIRKYRTICAKSLKGIFRKNNIKDCDLLKIDTEGAEYEILYSLDSTTLGKIKHISMEYHNINKEKKQDGNSLKKYLEGHGFTVMQKESLQRRVGYLFAINTRKR